MSLFDRIARLLGGRGKEVSPPRRPTVPEPEEAAVTPAASAPPAVPPSEPPAPEPASVAQPEPSAAEPPPAETPDEAPRERVPHGAMETEEPVHSANAADETLFEPEPVEVAREAPMPAARPAPGRRAALLVTGFGPFPGVPHNPSEVMVKAIAARRIPGVETRILPTEWAVCAGVTDLAAGARKVLMFGVARGARQIRYERMSRPTAAARLDAAGKTPAHAPTRTRRTRLDIARLVHEARRKGYKVAVSGNAGAYICNASYGAALARNPDTLFVHIPQPTRRGPLSPAGLEAHADWLVRTLLEERKAARVSSRRSRARAAGKARPRASAASSRRNPPEGRTAGRSGA